MKRALIVGGVAAATVLAAGCGSSGSSGSSSTPAAAAAASTPVTLRLGFLANITHAPALVGIREGFFRKELGSNVSLQLTPFSSGTQESTALLAGQLDAAYAGPNPAIKAWQTSAGKLIKVISGAASAGAQLVVKRASLWPGGQFVTTNLVVTQAFLAAPPSSVNGLLKAQIDANNFIHQHLAAAEAAANAELTSALGKGLKSSVLSAAFQQITFTNDPIASSLAADAQHAVAVGLLSPVSNISALYDLGPLNKLLAAAGEPQVSP